MIIILSPAKNMKSTLTPECPTTLPAFKKQTLTLHQRLKNYSPWELESLMKINETLALKAHLDFKNFDFDAPGVPALQAYDGLVFKNIAPQSLTSEDMTFIDQRLRILSGFYGLLRPTDSIHPYRLEMGTRLAVNDHKNLYAFWGDTLFDALYSQDSCIVNLASEEYAKCIRKYCQPFQTFIDIDFKTLKNGKLRTLATYAKMARGQMVRFLIDNRISSPEGLKAFNQNGYVFDSSRSTEKRYVFVQN